MKDNQLINEKGISWSWGAFFLEHYWYAYKKMYKESFFAFLAEGILFCLLDMSSFSWIYYVTFLGVVLKTFIGIRANNICIYRNKITDTNIVVPVVMFIVEAILLAIYFYKVVIPYILYDLIYII